MSHCNLCASENNISELKVEPVSKQAEVSLCRKCFDAVETADFSDIHHWHCLSEAIWHESSAVKVLSYSILNSLLPEAWAQDLMDQIYLEPQELEWAKSRIERLNPDNKIPSTVDSNGAPLLDGDSVTLIKDLDVKGGGFTAKRGSLVKGIQLTNNPEHIEGKVNGIKIVLVTKYLKKV